MNNRYVDVVDFLNHDSEQEHRLTDKLQTPVSEAWEDLALPHLLWDDVLQMVRSVYHISPEQERHILFLRSARQELPEHTHSYFELIYVLSGSCTHCINGNMETLQAGDLCILPPLARHIQFQDPASITAKLIILPSYFTHICPGLLQKADYLGSFLVNSIYAQGCEQYLSFHTSQNSSIRSLILEIGQESLRDDDYSDRIASGLLMSLLTRLARNYPSDLQSTPVRSIHHDILALLQKEYDTITLESLAKRLHYSVPYCSKYIKKLFGINFSNLLQQVRFQIAKQYLQSSDLTVIQISQKLGYENPENFIRAFKKYFSMTPAQYRKDPGALNAESPPHRGP